MVIHNTPLYYAIVYSSNIDLLDFNELITNKDGVRHSLDNSKGLVKWKGSDIPATIQNLSNFEGPYTQDEILNVMKSTDWTDPEQE